MNVLLTCAGRRTFLVNCFKEALADRGLVLACDSSDSAPGLAQADRSFRVPTVDHEDYYDVLLSICREHEAGLLISVNDLELWELACRTPRFRAVGTEVVVSAPETIALCQDKWTTCSFLRACGIATPATFLSLEAVRRALAREVIDFPLVLKPRWGTSSIGLMRAESDRELTLAYEWAQIEMRRSLVSRLNRDASADAILIQESIEGPEYGIDVVNDLQGRYTATLTRRKLAMRAGNTDRAITICDPRLERLGAILGQHLRHVGSLDCDVIDRDGECYVLDLNPRLGGGYPFCHMAGADLPAALIAWAEGRHANPVWLRCRPDVLVSKYDGMMVIDQEIPATVTYAVAGASGGAPG